MLIITGGIHLTQLWSLRSSDIYTTLVSFIVVRVASFRWQLNSSQGAYFSPPQRQVVSDIHHHTAS